MKNCTVNPKNFKLVWDRLPKKTQKEIQAKANWEHMTLSAVMQSWWPKVWQQIYTPLKRQ